MKYGFYLFLVPFFLLSCKQEQPKETKLTQFHQQWIKPPLWIPELHEFYNFPYWFDDSLIAANGIHEIQQKEYFVKYANIQEVVLKEQAPSGILTYYFNDAGKVISVKKEEFNNLILYKKKIREYDEQLMDSVFYFSTYQSRSDMPADLIPEGYSAPIDQQFALEHQTSNYTSFYNVTSDKHLFFITNKQLTSPIAVDTMLSPNPKDIIVIPNFRFPDKIYSVENKVLESNVLEFTYDAFQNLIRYSYRQKSSRVASSVLYNDAGFITGFKNAVFNGNDLVKTQFMTIDISKIGQPLMLYENTHKPMLKKIVVLEYK